MSFVDTIANAIPTVSLTPSERSAVLEIAFLAVASDQDIHEDEEAGLRKIAAKLGAPKEIDAIIQRLSNGRLDRESADIRLRELAKTLTTPDARAVAYKAAYAVAMADLASSDGEFEFDIQLIDALGISQDDVDRYAEEVMAAIQPQ